MLNPKTTLKELIVFFFILPQIFPFYIQLTSQLLLQYKFSRHLYLQIVTRNKPNITQHTHCHIISAAATSFYPIIVFTYSVLYLLYLVNNVPRNVQILYVTSVNSFFISSLFLLHHSFYCFIYSSLVHFPYLSLLFIYTRAFIYVPNCGFIAQWFMRFHKWP